MGGLGRDETGCGKAARGMQQTWCPSLFPSPSLAPSLIPSLFRPLTFSFSFRLHCFCVFTSFELLAFNFAKKVPSEIMRDCSVFPPALFSFPFQSLSPHVPILSLALSLFSQDHFPSLLSLQKKNGRDGESGFAQCK